VRAQPAYKSVQFLPLVLAQAGKDLTDKVFHLRHYPVLQQIGIEFQGNPYTGQAFIQSDSKIRWSMPSGASYLWFTEKGYMMVIDLIRPDMYVAFRSPVAYHSGLADYLDSLLVPA